MLRPLPHIVFAGGVTGGHLFPGLAVAEQLVAAAPNTRITFLGPGGRFDRTHVSAAGFDYLAVPCPRSPRGIGIAAVRFPLQFARAYRQASAFLAAERVSAVVGLGGFASAPAALATARLGRPLMLLEQNAIVGRTNRRLLRWAHAICLGMPLVAGRSPGPLQLVADRTVLTGTPIRGSFLQHFARLADADDDRSCDTLLVLGGSGGARVLNESVPAALAVIQPALRNWRIVHQSGETDLSATRHAYQQRGISAEVVPFLPNLPELLARAALAVSRAGGSTLAELAVTRIPTILVPMAKALDNHQALNAHSFARAGAACVVEEQSDGAAGLTGRLSSALAKLVGDSNRRQALSRAIGCFARPAAAYDVAFILSALIAGHDSPLRQQSPALLGCPPCIDVRAA